MLARYDDTNTHALANTHKKRKSLLIISSNTLINPS